MTGLKWLAVVVLFVGTTFSLVGITRANWMYLGIASVGTSMQQPGQGSEECSVLPGLILEQLRVCQENPQAMPCVSLGARLGIYECHNQFKSDRWNCTTTVDGQSVFGPVLSKGTRESAFIYAVTSAGVVHAVTASCSAGNLTDCGCDNSRAGQMTAEGWKWGGCSDNIDYGIWFARTFVDAPERIRQATAKDNRPLMNLHNNEVGRKTLATLMRQKCRCHGVSGSCAVKTCWKSMPSFSEVGGVLKHKYENSVEIASRASNKAKLRRREHRRRRGAIKTDVLVYMDDSPNYCKRDLKVGILGTRGRRCTKDNTRTDSCDMLCCGRGYNTKVVRYVERCHCKFVWCCEVRCKTCETLVDEHTCK